MEATLDLEPIEVTSLNGTAFVFVPEEDGGRVIQASQIASIVPNYKNGGSMIFLVNADKALSVSQTPEDIWDDLNKKGN